MADTVKQWEKRLELLLTGVKTDEEEWKGFCLYHEDYEPSASYNLVKQVFFCFACRESGPIHRVVGDLTRGEQKDGNPIYVPNSQVWEEHAGRTPTGDGEEEGPVTRRLADKYFFNLTMDDHWKDQYAWLQSHKGLTKDTIAEYRIGLREMTRNYENEGYSWQFRITIPVQDEDGEYVNIRYYDKSGKGKSKVINHKGSGEARLFPVQSLRGVDEVILCEGEWDAILTNQNGFAAVTSTGGAGTFTDEMAEQLSGKMVYIIFDNDEAGRQGAQKAAHALYGHATEVYIGRVPLSEDGSDLGDLWVREGYNRDMFRTLLDSAIPFSPQVGTALTESTEDGDEAEDPYSDAPVMGVAEAINHPNQEVLSVVGMVTNTTTASKHVITQATLTCEGKERQKCDDCAFNHVHNKRLEYKTDLTSDWVRRVLLDGDINQEEYIADECDAYVGARKQDRPCKLLSFEDVKLVKARKVYIANYSEEGDTTDIMQTLPAWAIGNGDEIQVGKAFKFSGHMRKNKASITGLVSQNHEPILLDLDRFEINEDVLNGMSEFQPHPGETVLDTVMRVAESFSPVTGIYGRPDIHAAFLITQFSPLNFVVDNIVRKGWLDTLMFGETRTGKTAVSRALLNYSRLGTIFSGENASMAGLVGGVDGKDGDRSITWGVYPRCDRRMLVMDEAGAIMKGTRPIISRLTSMRSEGKAEVEKIAHGSVSARVRSVMIANPSSEDRLLKYGYESMANLVGQDEDIARFDFVLYLDDSDRIGKQNTDPPPSPQVYRNHVLWAWTRGPADVVFRPGVVEMSHERAQTLSDILNETPLFNEREGYAKILRIASAMAALTASASDDGTCIDVREEHLEAALEWLLMIYSRESFGILSMAEDEIKMMRLSRATRDEVLPVAMMFPHVIGLMCSSGLPTRDIRGMGLNRYFNISGHGEEQLLTILSRTGNAYLRDGKWLAREGLKEMYEEYIQPAYSEERS